MTKRPIDTLPSEPSTKAKKSKGSQSSKSSKGQSSKEPLPRFINDASRDKYLHFCSPSWRQKIVPCYFIDSGKINQLGLEKIMEIFGELSIFLTCNEQISEHAVCEFYANLEKIGAELFSRVNSKNISITPQVIRQAFGIQYVKDSLNPYSSNTWPEKDWCESNGYDLVELSQRYFKVRWHKNISTKKEYKPKNLNASARVVYELMWLMLANSGGHSSEPTIGHVLLFFALMEGKKVDYARYLISHFSSAALGDRDLPCGNLIMKVLRSVKISNPSNSPLLECNEITQDFFKYKRVEYKAREEKWFNIKSKNPSSKPNQEESTSHTGNENLEAMIERAIEKAQTPLLEKIGALEKDQAPLLAKIEDLERALDKSLVLQSTLVDECDVMRQSYLMDMDDTRYNKVVAYRKELENLRIARLGPSAKNLRSEELRGAGHDDEDEGSSERTHTPSVSQSEEQSPLV